MPKTFKHSLDVEERYFSLDILALENYDDGFKQAIKDGHGYELEISLIKIFSICPRKRQRKQQYNRLVRFLEKKGIKLTIRSRKHKSVKAESRVV